MENYQKGELARKILLIVATGAVIPAVLVAPNIARVLLPALKRLAQECNSTPFKVKRSLTTLKRNCLVTTRQKNGETVMIITENGEKRIARGNFKNLSIIKPRQWDQKWRIVFFDIPENKRKARDSLRMKLRQLGFYQLQRSCFVNPYERRNEIDFITKFFDIMPYVSYLIADMPNDDYALRKEFNLPLKK